MCLFLIIHSHSLTSAQITRLWAICMPELAAAFSVGFIVFWLLTGVFFILIARRRESPTFTTLGKNLRQLNLYWSESTDQILPWTAEAEAADKKSAKKSILLMCGLLCFFSWVGVVLLLVLMISYRFLARTPLEKNIVSSPLALKMLEPIEVRKLLTEIAPQTAPQFAGAINLPSETKRP